MKQTLTAERNYWTSTGNNGADNNGRVYDYTWSGIGSAQRISLYYVRAAFVSNRSCIPRNIRGAS